MLEFEEKLPIGVLVWQDMIFMPMVRLPGVAPPYCVNQTS